MIYLIITTSVLNKIGSDDYEYRKKRYIDCIQTTLKFIENNNLIKPIIVENNGILNTYLDALHGDVIYTNNNIAQYQHVGVNELLDIKQVINEYNIKDNDIIIKLTGRYKPIDNSFFELILNESKNYDVFIKFFNVNTLEYTHDYCVSGLFAIKCKYLKHFSYKCDKNPESDFASYIRNNIVSSKIMEINNLNLECCFADNLQILNV